MSDNKKHKKLFDASLAGDVTRVTQLLKEGAQPDNYRGEFMGRLLCTGLLRMVKLILRRSS